MEGQRVEVSPDTESNVVQEVGQRDIFCLKGLPPLLELVCQTDTPTLLGYPIPHFLGDIPTHEVRCGFLTPLRSHFSRMPSNRELEVENGSRKTGSCHHLLYTRVSLSCLHHGAKTAGR